MLNLPIEYALVEFKGNKFSGKIVPELLDLAERGIVRFVDLVFIQKEKDGSIRTIVIIIAPKTQNSWEISFDNLNIE